MTKTCARMTLRSWNVHGSHVDISIDVCFHKLSELNARARVEDSRKKRELLVLGFGTKI